MIVRSFGLSRHSDPGGCSISIIRYAINQVSHTTVDAETSIWVLPEKTLTDAARLFPAMRIAFER